MCKVHTELQEYLTNNSYSDYNYFIDIRNDVLFSAEYLNILAENVTYL